MPNPRDIQHLAQQYGPQIVGVIVALLTVIGLAVGLTQNPPGSSSSPDHGAAAPASTTPASPPAQATQAPFSKQTQAPSTQTNKGTKVPRPNPGPNSPAPKHGPKPANPSPSTPSTSATPDQKTPNLVAYQSISTLPSNVDLDATVTVDGKPTPNQSKPSAAEVRRAGSSSTYRQG